ncbi:unnamed protein product [Oikopleura dioica]|uniref:CUB domain-containing protein n=1 Tax=Oikopleura dioica TaxID=34765 RepID=E4YHX0_OIKDI|nr:unnamed protein product [Oikopleura dioica]
MRLLKLFLPFMGINAVETSLGTATGLSDRYLHDMPLCPSPKVCRQLNPTCKGKILSKNRGRIRLKRKAKQNIDKSRGFSCRWEIVSENPNHRIRIRITQGKGFDIEHQQVCGADRLHVIGGGGEKFGRLCNSKLTKGMTYNGLPALLSYNRTKIPSKEWRDWIELPTNHLVIAFDSDGTISELSGGFRLVYQMVDRYFVPNEVREEIVNLKETEEILLSKIFTPGDKYHERISNMIKEHFNQIYEKWHECGGAALDPNFNFDENFLRGTSEIDFTGEIKAVYERYKDFIKTQLVDIGFCKKAHINRIEAKKTKLEEIFIKSCVEIGKCFPAF